MSTLLFVPANDEQKYQKAMNLPCKGMILDLEDAVHTAQKQVARDRLMTTLSNGRTGQKRLYVRMNGLHTPYWKDDLDAIAKLQIDGVVVPKADRDISMLDEYLLYLEEKHNLAPNQMRLVLMLETARSVVEMEAVLSASSRVECASLGLADLALDLGTSWEDLYAQQPPLLVSVREQLALTSKKLGLAAPWDSVYMKIRDPEGLRADALIGKRLGFQGKQVIHPAQVDTVNEVYRVTEEQYAKAKEVLTKMEGQGAAQLDGWLVDEPVVKRARQIVAAYEESMREAGRPD